jgi:hypothetical protein
MLTVVMKRFHTPLVAEEALARHVRQVCGRSGGAYVRAVTSALKGRSDDLSVPFMCDGKEDEKRGSGRQNAGEWQAIFPEWLVEVIGDFVKANKGAGEKPWCYLDTPHRTSRVT